MYASRQFGSVFYIYCICIQWANFDLLPVYIWNTSTKVNGITKWKLCKICLLMLSHCISLIYNFLGTGNKIEHAKYSDLSKSEGKKLQKSNCMAVTLFAVSAKNNSLPPMQLEVTGKSVSYKRVGRKPGCCFRLQTRGSETPSLEVQGNQPQALVFTFCLREKPCSHSVFWFLVNLGRDAIMVHLLVPSPWISLG